MPRQACLDSSGTLHHVIIRGIEWRRIIGRNSPRQQHPQKRIGDIQRRKVAKLPGAKFVFEDKIAVSLGSRKT
jgi:hypothetical protein